MSDGMVIGCGLAVGGTAAGAKGGGGNASAEARGESDERSSAVRVLLRLIRLSVFLSWMR